MDDFKNLHLNNHLCFALYTASNALTLEYSERLSEVGLSYEQYLVLLVLWQHQHQSIKAIAEKLHISPLALIPILRSLENAGLIEHASEDYHEHTSSIALTILGNQIQFKTSQIQQKMACETGLTQLEHLYLREKIDKMMANLQANVKRS